MEPVNPSLLLELFRHARTWLANLERGGRRRKAQSVAALRGVVLAARETAVYMRQLEADGARDHATERRLAVLWTELGFALEDLGIAGLAKRCRISGRHWADPERFDAEFLRKADVSLERMEQLAERILAGVHRD